MAAIMSYPYPTPSKELNSSNSPSSSHSVLLYLKTRSSSSTCWGDHGMAREVVHGARMRSRARGTSSCGMLRRSSSAHSHCLVSLKSHILGVGSELREVSSFVAYGGQHIRRAVNSREITFVFTFSSTQSWRKRRNTTILGEVRLVYEKGELTGNATRNLRRAAC